ncbi:lipid A deacylase LpxR family protein [Candidatus Kirkpatrickella diaphorinae]|uniref:Lipid A deacylase LpxR family protein n=1 Tax=Candidatus Kirkpatrickella diaphorinae TaxID=2984322 RepID=A0ABY6GLN9_9PROT|nr:lipid A deacylase LpxR family protein [Candidatus Kirkpatrickella diaphorinae]UYH51760.1 lipid A deacylase LpxR family protein [Candidatus Kirkpatrickella diaphorinae]
MLKSIHVVRRVAPCFLGVACVAQAAASPPTDSRSIWTLQAENDAVSTLKGTSDQYYTSGLRVNWTSGTDQLPRFFSRINRALLGDGVQRMSAGVQQLIFTPSNTQAATPLAGDRPYAGVLLGTLNLINDTDLSRSVVGIQLGVMGPAAGGKQVQNGFHSIIGDSPNRGWDHQLRNQPVFQVQGGRIWRFPLIKVAGIETDILPAISAAMGDYRIYGGGAATLRIGQGLDSDFGNATIGPGLDGTDAFVRTKPVAWYVYGGVEGQAVAFDASLQGNTFYRYGPHTSKKWDQGTIHAGVAVMWRGLRLSYSQNWQTAQFRQSRAGLFNYGSVKLSFKF